MMANGGLQSVMFVSGGRIGLGGCML